MIKFPPSLLLVLQHHWLRASGKTVLRRTRHKVGPMHMSAIAITHFDSSEMTQCAHPGFVRDYAWSHRLPSSSLLRVGFPRTRRLVRNAYTSTNPITYCIICVVTLTLRHTASCPTVIQAPGHRLARVIMVQPMTKAMTMQPPSIKISAVQYFW